MTAKPQRLLYQDRLKIKFYKSICALCVFGGRNNLKLPRYFTDIWAPKVFTILILRRFGSPMGLPNRRAWRGEATEALARAWDGVAA